MISKLSKGLDYPFVELMSLAGHIPKIVPLNELKEEQSKILYMLEKSREINEKLQRKMSEEDLDKESYEELIHELANNSNAIEELMEDLEEINIDITKRHVDEFYESMTEEELSKFTETQRYKHHLEEYRQSQYPDLKEILDSSNLLYFNKYQLKKSDKEVIYKFLMSLFGEKKKNYPSEDEIKAAFDEEQRFIVHLEDLANKNYKDKE